MYVFQSNLWFSQLGPVSSYIRAKYRVYLRCVVVLVASTETNIHLTLAGESILKHCGLDLMRVMHTKFTCLLDDAYQL